MPRYAVPANSDDEQELAAVFGSAVNLSIIRELQRHSPRTLGDLTEALAIGPSTVASRVRELEAHGVIIGDPPRGSRKQGTEASLSLDDVVIQRLLNQLEHIVSGRNLR